MTPNAIPALAPADVPPEDGTGLAEASDESAVADAASGEGEVTGLKGSGCLVGALELGVAVGVGSSVDTESDSSSVALGTETAMVEDGAAITLADVLAKLGC